MRLTVVLTAAIALAVAIGWTSTAQALSPTQERILEKRLHKSETAVAFFRGKGLWLRATRRSSCLTAPWRSACTKARRLFVAHVMRIERITALLAPPLTWRQTVPAWIPTLDCETGGTMDWHTNTGNGYYGGVQFDHDTWVAHGGLEFSYDAHLATPAQQVLVASRLTYDGWPNCPNP